jgi:hypothetical protein
MGSYILYSFYALIHYTNLPPLAAYQAFDNNTSCIATISIESTMEIHV